MNDETGSLPDPDLSQQAEQLLIQGDQEYLAGDYLAAIKSYEQGLSIYETLQDVGKQTLTLYRLGEAYYTLADLIRPGDLQFPLPIGGNDPPPPPPPTPRVGNRLADFPSRIEVRSAIFGNLLNRVPPATTPGFDPSPNPSPNPIPLPSPSPTPPPGP